MKNCQYAQTAWSSNGAAMTNEAVISCRDPKKKLKKDMEG